MPIVWIIVGILIVLGVMYLYSLLTDVAGGLLGLIVLLLTKRTARVVIGTLMLAGGLIFGLTSHSEPYQQLDQTALTQVHAYPSNDGNVYVQDGNNAKTFYVIHKADFRPSVQNYMFTLNGGFSSLIYNRGKSEEVSQISLSGFLEGTGYPVEQFTLRNYLATGAYTFTSSDYREHPQGFYQNNWLIGGSIAAIGTLLLALTFWLVPLLKTAEAGAPASPAPAYELPSSYPPEEAPPDPYMQSPGATGGDPYQS